jgi:EAL and modified HD-GYP domain-containing signal transduction protein
MDLLVAPKPIFHRSKEVYAYYLSFQIGNALLNQGTSLAFENEMHSPFFDFVNQIGLEALTSDKPIFIPVTAVHLATDLESTCKVDHNRVVLLMAKKVELSQFNLQRITKLRQSGFKTAFIHRTDYDSMMAFFPQLDYIFNDGKIESLRPLDGKIRKSFARTKVIARGIDTDAAFNRAVLQGVELLQGQFYKTVVIVRNNKVSPLKINYIQLLNQVSKDDFELDKFAGIVQRDTALAIQFLKMVNSSHVKGSNISSLRHAAALLGQKEIKKWVTTAVTTTLGQESPGEVTRLSMIRAKFCENLSGLFEMAIHKDNLFLMGLFSVLNVILEVPMDQALTMIFVPEPIKVALLGGQNDFQKIYEFVRLYEEGEWMELSRIALMNNMKITDIFRAYNDALVWYGNLISLQVGDRVTE